MKTCCHLHYPQEIRPGRGVSQSSDHYSRSSVAIEKALKFAEFELGSVQCHRVVLIPNE